MRIAASCFCLMVLAAGSAMAADKKPSAAEQAEATKIGRIDAVAKHAFVLSDRNHNDVLSRTEFPDAEALLEEGLMQLGDQKVLGQVPKGGECESSGQRGPALCQ